jgi:hypothetical protein
MTTVSQTSKRSPQPQDEPNDALHEGEACSSPVDSEASSTVRDLTPEPIPTLPTTALADTAVIHQDPSQQVVAPGQNLDAIQPNEKTPTKPFSSFTKKQKWGIVILSSIAGLFSPISSVILAPSLPVLVEQFQRSSEEINLTMTLYL